MTAASRRKWCRDKGKGSLDFDTNGGVLQAFRTYERICFEAFLDLGARIPSVREEEAWAVRLGVVHVVVF